LVVTETTYDALNRVTAVIARGDPNTSTDDRTTTYTYNRMGDLYCVKSPTGSGTEYFYDSAGRLTEIRRGLAVTTPSVFAERRLFTLDAAGHRINEKLDRGTSSSSWTNHAETSWAYGTICHLDQKRERIDASTEAVTDYAYDCDGNLESVWDPLHPKASFPSQPSTAYEYDPLNRVVAVAQPWGGAGGGSVTTHFEYDVQDHLVKVTDGEGTETSYVYSDRDLMTSQTSEVSGVTTHEYNDHGQLVSTTDALDVTLDRQVDAADRLTSIDDPWTPGLITYTWGTSATGWQKGRLISIARDPASIDYSYDPFGEVLTEGELGYTYDKNGNRVTVSYPGSLLATYGFDRMDRHIWLQLKEGTGTPFYLVKNSPAATYKPYGPLTTLRFDLTTDRDETRTYDNRYAPTSLTVPASPENLLAWTYATDLSGNVLSIDDTIAATNQDRSFSYQDWQYFLTSATGPWSGPLSWTYDRIGNRLSETRGATTDTYTYQANAASLGNTSELDEVLNLRDYTFDAAGQLESVAAGGNTVRFFYEPTGELQQAIRGARWGAVSLYYDGRRYLAKAESQSGGTVESTYSSEGLLMSLLRSGFKADEPERTNILYFAGRPIGIWSKLGTQTATLKTLTTDHLGAPIFALNSAGSAHWYGGFEPFGRDWQEGTANDALTKGIPLRLPGQWDDPAWTEATLGADLFYNVHRWYEPQTGRYASFDPHPQGRTARTSIFAYADQRPVRFNDPFGLFSIDGSCDTLDCEPSGDPFGTKLNQVRSEIQASCSDLSLIVDSALRDCTSQRCDSGVVTCVDEYQRCNAPTPPGKFRAAYGRIGKGNKAVLCPSNWPKRLPVGTLGDAVIHEWAHTCEWRHEDPFAGVP